MFAVTVVPELLFWFVIVVVGFIFLCVCLLIARLLGSIARGVSNLSRPVRSAEARVVTKRTEVNGHPHQRTFTAYFGTFEFADGFRREFRLSGEEFGLLVEGDTGRLSWQGTAYRQFQRQLAPEKFPLESQAEL